MRQLGNAVPVLLAETVALSVREHLDHASMRAATTLRTPINLKKVESA